MLARGRQGQRRRHPGHPAGPRAGGPGGDRCQPDGPAAAGRRCIETSLRTSADALQRARDDEMSWTVPDAGLRSPRPDADLAGCGATGRHRRPGVRRDAGPARLVARTAGERRGARSTRRCPRPPGGAAAARPGPVRGRRGGWWWRPTCAGRSGRRAAARPDRAAGPGGRRRCRSTGRRACTSTSPRRGEGVAAAGRGLAEADAGRRRRRVRRRRGRGPRAALVRAPELGARVDLEPDRPGGSGCRAVPRWSEPPSLTPGVTDTRRSSADGRRHAGSPVPVNEPVLHVRARQPRARRAGGKLAELAGERVELTHDHRRRAAHGRRRASRGRPAAPARRTCWARSAHATARRRARPRSTRRRRRGARLAGAAVRRPRRGLPQGRRPAGRPVARRR